MNTVMTELFGDRFTPLAAGSETSAAVHTREQVLAAKELLVKVPMAKMNN